MFVLQGRQGRHYKVYNKGYKHRTNERWVLYEWYLSKIKYQLDRFSDTITNVIHMHKTLTSVLAHIVALPDPTLFFLDIGPQHILQCSSHTVWDLVQGNSLHQLHRGRGCRGCGLHSQICQMNNELLT